MFIFEAGTLKLFFNYIDCRNLKISPNVNTLIIVGYEKKSFCLRYVHLKLQ